MKTKKIIFISALHEELRDIAKHLGTTLSSKRIGSITKKGRYIFALSGIGKVYAACSLASLLATEENVACVINIGLAGSLVKKFCMGEVVLADKTFEHDGKIEGSAKTQAKIYPLLAPFSKISHLKKGTLATGDQFISDPKIKHKIKLAGGELVDMEGAALAKVASIFDQKIILIKIISDNADTKAKEDFDKNLHTSKILIPKLEKIFSAL